MRSPNLFQANTRCYWVFEAHSSCELFGDHCVANSIAGETFRFAVRLSDVKHVMRCDRTVKKNDGED